MRVEGTLEDRGHYTRKIAGYTALTLAAIPYVVCFFLGRAAEWFAAYPVRRLHRWMRPCVYARRPQ